MTPQLGFPASPTARRRLALAAIVLVALAVRLYDLSAESIWTDEAYSIDMARRPTAEIVARTAEKDTTPPLYYLSLHAWQRLFGDSPAAMRMPSVILGTLGVLFAYLAAAPLIGRTGALVAALIHALSPFHVAYSQEVRQYALLSCASIASFAFLIRLLNRQRFATPAYIAATILMCYAHSVGSFVLLAQIVFVASFAVIARGFPWQRTLAAQAVAIGMFLPWAIFSIRQYRRIEGVFWVPVPSIYSVAETFYEYVRSELLLELFLLLAILGFVQLTPIAGRLSWRNVVASLENKTWRVQLADLRATWLLICWLAIPIATLFVISRVATPMYLTRATIVASSAFYVLVARGIAQFRGTLRVGCVIIVAALLSRELGDYYRTVTKESWSELVTDISALVQPGDVFVFHQRSRRLPFDYYFTREGVRRIGFPDRPFAATDVVTESDMETLPQWVDDSDRVWLVLAYSKDERQLIATHLLRTRNIVFHRQYGEGFGRLDVRAFDKARPDVP